MRCLPLLALLLAAGCHLAHYKPTILPARHVQPGASPRVALHVQTLTDPRGIPGPAQPLLLAIEPTGPQVIPPTTATDTALLALLAPPDDRSAPPGAPPRGTRLAFAGGVVEVTPEGAHRLSATGEATPLLVLSPPPECPPPGQTPYRETIAACVSVNGRRLAVVRTLWSRCEARVQAAWIDADGSRPLPDVIASYTPGPNAIAEPQCATHDDGALLAAFDGTLVAISPGGATSSLAAAGVYGVTALATGGYASVRNEENDRVRVDFLDAAATPHATHVVDATTRYPGVSLTSDATSAIVLEFDAAELTAIRIDATGKTTRQSVDLSSHAPPAVK